MADNENNSGRTGNIIKNSALGFISNVLPSMLRFFSRYVFLIYFGDTLLGVNSLFADVIALFSFAEMGINAAVSFFLYKPIAENDQEKIQSFLALYRTLNRYIILAVTVVGIGFIPFLQFIKTSQPIPGLLIYYLIFIAQNIFSYLFSYRIAYITAAQKAYQLSKISITIAFATEIAQILVTILTQSFVVYLLTYLAMVGARVVWMNAYIKKHYPETCFKRVKPLDKGTRKEFIKKTKSLFMLKLAILGVSQTDSIIVSTMVDIVQWGYVSNYLAIKKIITLVLSSLAGGILPSLGNLTVVESREKQEETFKIYSFCNAWMCINIFACLVILVPPFISLVFGAARVLDDVTCFVLFINVLYYGLLEAVSVLRDARGLYEKDKWITFGSFLCNLVTSIFFVWLYGLPGVFVGTMCGTTVTYLRIHAVIKDVFGTKSWPYYWQAIKTMLLSLVIYGILQFWVHPAIWAFQSNFLGLILSGVATLLVTNFIFILANLRDPYLGKSLRFASRFIVKLRPKTQA